MSSETIAFYGTGMLGSAMVRSALQRGVTVRLWNRTHAKALELESDGAQVFADPAEAAHGAQRVHLCLRDDAAVDAVLSSIVHAVSLESPIVDHTTVLPEGVVARAARLGGAGHAFLHAPVFMGPPMALVATGVMMTSGSTATFERVRPALTAMCSDLRYLGERPDLAALFKLMGNAMILATIGGLNDMYRMAECQGISRAQAHELFTFYSPASQLTGRGKRMADEQYAPAWTLEMAHKDATLMQGAAHHERLPVVDAIELAMRDAIARGFGGDDLGAIARR